MPAHIFPDQKQPPRRVEKPGSMNPAGTVKGRLGLAERCRQGVDDIKSETRFAAGNREFAADPYGRD
jgi:hypothetical protein